MIEREVLNNVPVKDIHLNPENPRINEEAVPQVMKSIKMSDYISPIIVDETDMIMAGNTRYKALLTMGRDTIPIVIRIKGMTKVQKDAFILADNKAQEFSIWDWEKLAGYPESVLKDVGFSDTDIDKILNPDVDDYDVVTNIRENVDIKTGDLFQVGPHKLLCGDSRDFEMYKKLMGDQKAEMIFTDPPYNVDFHGGMSATGQHHRDPLAHDNMSAEDFYKFLHDSIAPMMEYCPGVFYICMSGKELPSLKKAFEELGGHWQSFIVWVKNTFTLSRSDWQSQYEPILYGWNGKTKDHYFAGWRDEGNVWQGLEEIRPEYHDGKTYIKLGEYHLELEGEVKGRVANKKNQMDVWLEKKPAKSPWHSTSKPIALCRKGIEASSHRASIVLDPFLGGGSTIMACQECGRIGYGIELDARYIDVCIRRLNISYPDLPILKNGVEYDKNKLKTDTF